MRWAAFILFATLAGTLGCNFITGAGDLRVGEEWEDAHSGLGGDIGVGPTGPGGSGPGEGAAAGTGGTTGTGAPTGGSGTGAGPTGPLGYADGVSVTDLDIYQALRRPLLREGQPASSDLPIVAGRDAMLRVFYRTDGGFNGQPVTARLTVGATAVEQTASIGGTSSHHQLASTFNLDVPGDLLAPGAAFKVELLQPEGTTSGTNGLAAYPAAGGTAPMGVESGGTKLRIKLVPVQNGGTLPDTSPAQLDRYVRWFSEIYPIPAVEVTVRSSAYSFNGNLVTFQGWSDLLDEISDLRDSDGAADDVYYYGIHGVDAGGLLGLGFVAGPTDARFRAAIGVGWSGETAPETAVHEIGHNHGRSHAPCGVSDPDPNFPHLGARIGVWGYSPSRGQLFDPSIYVDFMSYCAPAWISDYTYKALFERLRSVSMQPYIHVPLQLVDRSYDRIKVLGQQAVWKDVVSLARPMAGEAIELSAYSAKRGSHTLTASYFPYSNVPGGVLLLMQPSGTDLADRITQVTFTVEGATFTLTR